MAEASRSSPSADANILDVKPAHVVQKGADSGNSKPIIDMFAAENYAKTDGANINELYNKMSQSDYEQFLVHINFTEPYYLRDAIINSVQDGGIGFAKDQKDVEILDFGLMHLQYAHLDHYRSTL